MSILGNTLNDNFDDAIRIEGAGTGLVTINNNSIRVGQGGIDLEAGCNCDDVHISGTTAAESNCFSGSLTSDVEFYLANESGADIEAQYNYWAGDTDPDEKICAVDQNNVADCDHGGGDPPDGDVDWSPVASSCAGVATVTPTPTITGTITPTLTPTVTGTPPTSTPTNTATPTGPTATPTTGPMESVTLAGGHCNPVISTYADGTPIATIAAGVSPSGILISIWWFNPGTGDWLGYSPQFPSVSDLANVDRLEVIFICVSSQGNWSRPII